ncbi:MAG: (deoxy)nucleoside triphosphate pyrophosphohydrolase [Desulfobacteraceae bacterium]|nr:(deoxy)nucleoside triphosphate pyrophosphohydrolase [Desulfobacteraceae bacterium]
MLVSAALIASGKRLFIAQRPPWKKFGYFWEFPGGKVEPGESLEESLVREIREELCLDISVHEFFGSISHEYDDFSIELHAFWCGISGGSLCLKEHVAYRWVEVAELEEYRLTEADRLLIRSMKDFSVFPGT